MSQRVRLGEYLLGLEGLALLRLDAARRGELAGERVDDIRTLLQRLNGSPFADVRQRPEAGVEAGYTAWAAGYDAPGNITIALEEPAVQTLLAELPPGRVLDAACGTGRHSLFLAERGHDVLGVDITAAMLARARDKVPGAALCLGDLTRLPIATTAVDAAVCGLALAHFADLALPVAELARVVVPGGHVVISIPHPIVTAILGWVATVPAVDGSRSVIPEYVHWHSAYIDAFTAARLRVRRCIEPTITATDAAADAGEHFPAGVAAALTGLPAVLVWDLIRA